ncbi:hypothetical protein L7F22_001621, partial [Adiantum nelumboides]|nr:hypothetical protein [Adiantum nelumboides]
MEEENPTWKKAHKKRSTGVGGELEEYTTQACSEHFEEAFSIWRFKMKFRLLAKEQPHIKCTEKQVLYRWWSHRLQILNWYDEHSSDAGVYSE